MQVKEDRIRGRAVPYGVTVELSPELREVFEPGAFRAQTKDPGRARMCLEHGQVIGPIISLEEREDGLYFEAGISRSDAIPEARRARALIEEGLADELSVGFNTVRNGTTVTREDDGTHLAVHHRAKLLEISLVPWGVYSREAVLQRARLVDHTAELLEARRAAAREALAELRVRVASLPVDGDRSPHLRRVPAGSTVLSPGVGAPKSHGRTHTEVIDAQST